MILEGHKHEDPLAVKMLHVVTEVGKPGRNERERRHYPGLDNEQSKSADKPRARKYIPHGYGEDYEFVPHNRHINPRYTECGPDWKSRLRYLPAPHNPDYVVEIWPEPWKALRTGYQQSRPTEKEWTLYPEGYDSTLRTSFDGVHKATETTEKEVTDSSLFGRSKVVINKRNGLTMASPGDKSYQAVEYSPKFHKFGSTLPLVNFGGNYKPAVDTFVPLENLPPINKEKYREKEVRRKMAQDIDSVRMLERWRPATPLVPASTTGGPPVSFRDTTHREETVA